MEFQTLADWIAALLQQPPDELDRKWSDCQVTEESVSQIAEIKRHGSEHYGCSIVSLETLLGLHRKLRGLPCEDTIWSSIILHLEKPLPSEVAHDLLDRAIASNELEHSRQEDDVQQRMAEGGEEALLTWALALYCDARRSLREFESVLKRFSDNEWMLETLMSANASWPDKEIALNSIVNQHAESERLLQIGKVHRAEQRAADWGIGRDEFESLYQMNEPDVLLTLAFNPRTPIVYLRAMSKNNKPAISTIGKVDLASQIRNAARHNLRRWEINSK